MVETKEQTKKERIVAGSHLIFGFLLIVVAFFLISSENLQNNNEVIKIFFIYSFANFTLPLITIADINTKLQWFKSFMFHPHRSLIAQLHKQDRKNNFFKTLNKINNNYIISLIFWISFFAIPMFFAQLFAPQTAFGNFISTYVFPVRQQSIFNVFSKQMFFNLYPALSESGALTVAISVIESIMSMLFKGILGVFLYTWLSMFIIGISSAFIWRFIHKFVSAGRELDVAGHTFFGFQSGVLNVLTGQWTPHFALHLMNLFFWTLRNEFTSNEFLRTGLLWVFIIISLGIVIVTYNFNKDKK